MLPVLPMPQVFPVLLEIPVLPVLLYHHTITSSAATQLLVRVELARPQARKLMNAFITLQEQFSHVNPSQLSTQTSTLMQVKRGGSTGAHCSTTHVSPRTTRLAICIEMSQRPSC